jgi:hypothetical protein
VSDQWLVSNQELKEQETTDKEDEDVVFSRKARRWRFVLVALAVVVGFVGFFVYKSYEASYAATVQEVTNRVVEINGARDYAFRTRDTRSLHFVMGEEFAAHVRGEVEGLEAQGAYLVPNKQTEVLDVEIDGDQAAALVRETGDALIRMIKGDTIVQSLPYSAQTYVMYLEKGERWIALGTTPF